MITKTMILNHKQITQKIRRIAFQIIEFYHEDKELVIVGVAQNGFTLAEKIAKDIESIHHYKPILCKLNINKKKPLVKPIIDIDKERLKGKNIVLVDDVLNTGSTLMYTVKHILDYNIKSLKTAILIDRSHKNFPIKADFKGMSLSTSLSETVQVTFSKDSSNAELL